MGIIYTILGRFCSFFNWKGVDIHRVDLEELLQNVTSHLGMHCFVNIKKIQAIILKIQNFIDTGFPLCLCKLG